MVMQVTILGATGSIGRSTLDVIARHEDRFRAWALTANCDWQGMAEICRTHNPRVVVMVDSKAAGRLAEEIAGDCPETTVLAGAEALIAVATDSDVDAVMAAIVGAAGLVPTLAAARAGKRILLANKEALVMSGALFMDAVATSGAELVPIDSEHNAVFQCLPHTLSGSLENAGVTRIVLTASGGPFRTWPMELLAEVTPEQAVAHPNWVMGPKISVDSATMMNKGLEVIEACWLFDVDARMVDVVIHPQSIVHSMVQYADGSVLAQLGNPDMRTPIAHALGWPERIDAGVEALQLVELVDLQFSAPDLVRFPCLRLAFQAQSAGRAAPAILNAANEVAVAAFLDRRLAYTGIPEVIEEVLARVPDHPVGDLDDVLAVDAEARRIAATVVSQHA